MTQGAVVSKLLRSLPPKFNYVVCSIEQSTNTDLMTIDELHSTLVVQEQRLSGQEDEEQALKVAEETKERRWSGGARGEFRGRSRGAWLLQ
ncbi:unnamed protein product [Rhodiola kirilowii]